ncbi:MAG: oligoribonuclease [Mariprofundus sp.]
MPMIAKANNLVWMDLEMTGLEPDHDLIIEIATIVTDANLNVIAEGPSIVIHQPEDLLEGMDEWNTTHHGESGLTAKVRASQISMGEAEQTTLDFLRKHISDGASPLCGNSVHQDRRFLVRYMPKLENFVHYRNIDVSTIKELARRWYPEDKAPIKHAEHQALSDVRESINELIWYRQHIFKK